ncbi:MAG TPA: HNH endonuclease [Polyangiaceae bacterium]
MLRPDYPRARRRGHALRAHIVWWLTTGEAPPEDKHLHHKNHDKLDDRFENLELMGVAEHMAHHRHHAGRVELPCAKCGTPVSRERNRVRYNRVFCSHACYAAFPKSAETRGRHRQAHLGERHWAAKLNAEAVRLIRSSTESAEALAERYGVKLVTINAARRGYNWSHV